MKYGTSFAAEGVDQSAIEVDYTEICFTPGVETSDLQIYTWDIHYTFIIGSDKSTRDLIGQLEIIRNIIGRRMLRDGLRLKYDGHKYDL